VALQTGYWVRAIVGGKVATGLVIATQPYTTEGQFSAGPGRLSIPIHDAGSHTMEKVMKVLYPIAQEAGGQAKLRITSQSNGFIQVAGTLYREHRPKVFAVLYWHSVTNCH